MRFVLFVTSCTIWEEIFCFHFFWFLKYLKVYCNPPSCDPCLRLPSSLPVHRPDDDVPPAALLPQDGRPARPDHLLPAAALRGLRAGGRPGDHHGRRPDAASVPERQRRQQTPGPGLLPVVQLHQQKMSWREKSERSTSGDPSACTLGSNPRIRGLNLNFPPFYSHKTSWEEDVMSYFQIQALPLHPRCNRSLQPRSSTLIILLHFGLDLDFLHHKF